VIIMGIDPGSRVTGYGIIRKSGEELSLIGDGEISPPRNLSLYEKTFSIFLELKRLIQVYAPDELAIEDIFHYKNPKSSIKLGHIRGAIIIASFLCKVPVFEYTPLQIKKALTGYGNAAKEQVKEMVKVILNIKKDIGTDTSDALAIAICHANSRNWIEYDRLYNRKDYK